MLFNTVLSAQTVSFTIKVFGSKVGRMDVTRVHQPDGTDLYTMQSNSHIKFLWITKDYTSKFEARYKDGKLLSASHVEKEAGNIKRWSTVTADGANYVVDSDKGRRTFAEPPKNCDLTMYFEDCRKIKRLFYVAEANFNDVTKIDDTCFEFKSSDGHRNVYHCQNGEIKQMEFHLPIATVYMDKVQ